MLWWLLLYLRTLKMSLHSCLVSIVLIREHCCQSNCNFCRVTLSSLWLLVQLSLCLWCSELCHVPQSGGWAEASSMSHLIALTADIAGTLSGSVGHGITQVSRQRLGRCWPAQQGPCSPKHFLQKEKIDLFPLLLRTNDWVMILIRFLWWAVWLCLLLSGLTAGSLWPTFPGSSRQQLSCPVANSVPRPAGGGHMPCSAGTRELVGSRSRAWWAPGPRAILPEMWYLHHS